MASSDILTPPEGPPGPPPGPPEGPFDAPGAPPDGPPGAPDGPPGAPDGPPGPPEGPSGGPGGGPGKAGGFVANGGLVGIKIVRGQRPIPKEKAPEAPKESEQEQMAKYLDTFTKIPSRLRIMDYKGSMKQLLPYIDREKETAIAFDFDQTITLVHQTTKGKAFSVRGGEETIETLKLLKKKGIPMCIITAQPTTLKVVHSMADELRKLGLDDVFDVETFAPSPVLDLIKKWGSNYTMSLEKLTQKLIMLICINSDRYPSDVARISYKRTKFFDSTTETAHNYNEKVVLEEKARLLKIEQDARLKQEQEEKKQEEIANEKFLEENKHLDEDSLLQAKRKRKEELLLAADEKAKKESPEWEVDFRLPIEPKEPFLITPGDIPTKCVYSIAVLTPEGNMPEVGHEQWSFQNMRAVGRRVPPFQTRLRYSVHSNSNSNSKGKLLSSKLELSQVDDLKDTENFDEKNNTLFCASATFDPRLEAHLQTKYSHVIHETNPNLCPVRCWLAFMIRTRAFRSVSNPVDRLFIDCFSSSNNSSSNINTSSKNSEHVAPVLTISQIEELVKKTLKEAKVNPEKWESVLKERGSLIETKGCKVACLGNTFASLRNKPEAFEYFLEKISFPAKRLIFVDDNSDNAFNMFMYFARPQVAKMNEYDMKKLTHITATTLHVEGGEGAEKKKNEEDSDEKENEERFGLPNIFSFWYQPAIKVEAADPVIFDMLQALVTASGGKIPEPPPIPILKPTANDTVTVTSANNTVK